MNSRKILLLNPPGDNLYIRDNYCSFSSKANYYWPPIDLLVLSGILSARYEVSVLDANIEGVDFAATLERISDMGVEVLVVVTGTASLQEDMRLVQAIKDKIGVHIVASGGVLLFEAAKIMEKYPFLDCITYDFSDSVLLEYLDKTPGPHPNLIYREGGQVGGWRAEMGKACPLSPAKA